MMQTTHTTQMTHTTELQRVCPSPWQRYFARSIDRGLLLLLIEAFKAYILQVPLLSETTLPRLLVSWLVTALLFLVFEPIALRYAGTTPGKAIFGIHLRHRDGRKLTLAEARARLVGVWFYGQALGLPIISLYRLYRSYQSCRDEHILEWDSDTSYLLKPHHHERYLQKSLAVIGIAVASIALLVLMALSQLIPPHRGDLTLAQYAENYNYYLRYYGLEDEGTLDADGKWQPPAPGNNVQIQVIHEPVLPLEFTLEDGYVRGVELSYRTEKQFFMVSTFWNQRLVASAALTSAQGSRIDAVRGHRELIGFMQAKSNWRNYDTTINGIPVCGTMTTLGYETMLDTPGALVGKDEDATHRFEITFAVGGS